MSTNLHPSSFVNANYVSEVMVWQTVPLVHFDKRAELFEE